MVTTPYERIGGEQGLLRLVKRFYELMSSLPEAQAIRRLHPTDISTSEHKLFLFLSGWFGGPPLYLQQVGHPRLRARHLPFPIGVAERDAWMLCMTKALDEIPGLDELFRQQTIAALFRVADHMRNQDISVS
ncbi:MAG: group II truncated hemoglobin [Gammaproteobacteria bacterium]|nr:group II truncated hemoglobin [Gammaproteobacteria bacterium]